MKNVLRNSLVSKKVLIGALFLSTAALAQEGPDPDIDFPDPHPCNGEWYDRIPNAEAPIPINSFTGIKYGHQKIVYVNGDVNSPDYGKVTNIYGSNYQNHATLSSASVPVESSGMSSSDVIIANGAVYYVGATDHKFHKLTYSASSGWLPQVINNQSTATSSSNTTGFGGSFDVNPVNNRIFYNHAYGNETDVSFIDGPNWWQVGPIDAPGSNSTGEIVKGDWGIYYRGDDFKLHLKVWDPNNGWQTNSISSIEMDYLSPLTYSDGKLFYIDEWNHIRIYDEVNGVFNQILNWNSVPPHVGRNDMVTDNHKLVYVGVDHKIYMMKETNGVWDSHLLHPTAEVRDNSKMDFIDGRGIVYVNRFDNKIHELYFCGFSLKKEATSETNMANTPQIKDFTVYPNPAEDQVVIAVNAELPGTIQVVNIAGQVVQQETYNEGIYQEQMDIQNLDKGIYFIRIISNSGEQLKVEKLIKK